MTGRHGELIEGAPDLAEGARGRPGGTQDRLGGAGDGTGDAHDGPVPVDQAPADQRALAEAFETERAYLRGVAYRILGSLSDADDIVQEAWLRLVRTDPAAIDSLRGWLTVVVGRLCLDHLRSARVRRESYVGPWLPEPIVGSGDIPGIPRAAAGGRPGPAGSSGGTGGDAGGLRPSPASPAPGQRPPADTGAVLDAAAAAAGSAEHADPADRVTLAESVSMALLVVMETLSPAERTAFVLHDVFGFSFDEVAQVTGRTPAASRQLASRARRHVRDRAARFDSDPDQQRRAVDAFLSAAAGGDMRALLAVLDPDVVLRADGGGVVRAARRPVIGADRVARFLLGLVAKAEHFWGRRPDVRPAQVNGGPGLLLFTRGQLVQVMAVTVADGRITEIDVVANPAKLRHVAAELGVPVAAPLSGGVG